MKITIATVGTRGDVQPYVALGLGLRAAGHQVQIATDPLFQSFIEDHGLGFTPVNADLRQAMQEVQIEINASLLGDQIPAENGVANSVNLISSYLQNPQHLMRFHP